MPTRREARTSVLPEGQNLGAGGIQFRRASKNRRGPPGRRAVLGRFPPRAMTTRLPMNSTSFKIRKVERRGAEMPMRREARTSVLPGGQNLGAGGIQFRRAGRGALCAPPVCSAGRRADEGIGPYGIRRGGRPQGASLPVCPRRKRRGPPAGYRSTCICGRAGAPGRGNFADFTSGTSGPGRAPPGPSGWPGDPSPWPGRSWRR